MRANISNRMINRIINLTVITGLNFIFSLVIILSFFFLFTYGLNGNYSLLFLIIIILSALPALSFIHERIDLIVSPARYNDLYVKTIDSILNIESFDELIYKIFDVILKLMKAGYGRIIFYRSEKEVFDIQYQKDKSRGIVQRKRTDNDYTFLEYIKGPDDILIKSKYKRARSLIQIQ